MIDMQPPKAKTSTVSTTASRHAFHSAIRHVCTRSESAHLVACTISRLQRKVLKNDPIAGFSR